MLSISNNWNKVKPSPTAQFIDGAQLELTISIADESLEDTSSPGNEVFTVNVNVPGIERSTVPVNVYSIVELPSRGPATTSVTDSPSFNTNVTSKSDCVAPPKLVITTDTCSALDNNVPDDGDNIEVTPMSLAIRC